ncbi:MAG: MBL fold metallo-hydrolase [Rhodothermales bacterium]
MRVQFWGVRGSIPVPGPETMKYGGNTPCLTVSLDESHTLILDAGTGLAAYGRTLPEREHTYIVALSHVHWDHIHGFPMFAPLMAAGTRVVFLTGMEPSFMDHLLSQMDGIHFPVPADAFPVRWEQDSGSGQATLGPLGVAFSWMPVNHSGTCFAYRISGPEGDLVYMTDNELGPEHADVVAFCRDADVLVHDAQYTAAERSRKTGWGHSFVPDVCRLAEQAGVRELILFHHDPIRTDVELDAIQAQARAILGPSIACVAAAEGMHREL